MTNWEKIYNEFPESTKRFAHWYAGKVKKETRTWYIDRRGNFIIQWQPGYIEEFTKIKWIDFYEFLKFYGVNLNYNKIDKINAPDGELNHILVGNASISEPYAAVVRTLSSREDIWKIINWSLSHLENRPDRIRDIKIDMILNNIYDNDKHDR